MLTLSLLTIGVLSSFKSAESLSSTADTWDPTDTGTGTGTGTGEEDNGRMLTTVSCTVVVNCPGGKTVSESGFSMQCLSNSGYCHASNEAGCDADEPNCP